MLNIRPQNMDLSNLTIIIPSYNRPQHVIQTLKFWSKFNVNLHLVDGSKKPVLDFQNIIINTKIKYHHIQILSEVDRIKKILPLIKTKYSILSSDDDVLLPFALYECLNELENDKDIISCYGQTLSFYKKDNEIKFNRTDKELSNFKNDSNDKIKRLNKHMRNYVPSIIYSVMTSNLFKNIFNVENFSQFKFFASLELRATLLVNYYGKSKVIDNLLVLRNKSENSAIHRNSENTSFFRCMYYPGQKDQRYKFINQLVKTIKDKNMISDKNLFKMFNSSLFTYLLFTFKRFFTKKLPLIFKYNIPLFYRMNKEKKLSKLISISELSYFCKNNNIHLNIKDQDLIHQFFNSEFK